MTNIIRSAKSGSDWTDNELHAYNIRITFQDAQTFFGEIPLPAPSINDEVLAVVTANDAVEEVTYNLLSHLDLVMTPSHGDESAVDDFAVALFQSLGYIRRPRLVRTRKELGFIVCGEKKCAIPDVCMINRSTNDYVILLVQRFRGSLNSYAQLIAGAIAAFQNNNAQRQLVGLAPLNSKIMPGIIMRGTAPSFFKIPVTKELVQCVVSGQYPAATTTVAGHVPYIPRPDLRFSGGMRPLDNRRAFLQCYEAFKKFVF